VDHYLASGADFGGGQSRSLAAPSSSIRRTSLQLENSLMWRQNPFDTVLAAVCFVILLCASFVIGIELSKFLGAIWR